MFVSTAQWRAGEQVWSVQHRGGDYGVDDLVIEGTPPEPFEEIRARCFAAQQAAKHDKIGVDYVFDIPVELGRSIVGFRHDQADAHTDGNFRELHIGPDSRLTRAAARPPWWKFW
jgi:hypothetical protein